MSEFSKECKKISKEFVEADLKAKKEKKDKETKE
jgi:hypothetical protein